VITGPFSPLLGPFFRAKRAGPARLGPLRAGLGQKIKPAGTAGPARFLAGLHRARAGPGRAARLAISNLNEMQMFYEVPLWILWVKFHFNSYNLSID
jgi:hypothetical protein